MGDLPKLLLVQADPVFEDGDGRWAIAAKTLSGVREFARRWPGEVVVSAPVRRSESLEAIPLHEIVERHDLPFGIVSYADPVVAAKAVAPAVALALHTPRNYPLLAWDAARTVFTLENDARQRLRIESMQDATVQGRARIAVGHARRFPEFRRSLRRAAGLQCNGYAAWESVRRLATPSILFFDHRITESDLRVVPHDRPLRRGALKLGFSGRHIPIKGPGYAIDLVEALRAEGVEVEMTVFGDGALRSALEAEAGEGVRFTGDLPFAEEWVPEVRDDIDVMVLPYPQGDPAGTYIEAFALGVPVLGFANDAFRPLVERHDVGWAVPVGDRRGLLAQARDLYAGADEVRRKSMSASSFAKEHSMENEFGVRVAHLRDIAQV